MVNISQLVNIGQSGSVLVSQGQYWSVWVNISELGLISGSPGQNESIRVDTGQTRLTMVNQLKVSQSLVS